MNQRSGINAVIGWKCPEGAGRGEEEEKGEGEEGGDSEGWQERGHEGEAEKEGWTLLLRAGAWI